MANALFKNLYGMGYDNPLAPAGGSPFGLWDWQERPYTTADVSSRMGVSGIMPSAQQSGWQPGMSGDAMTWGDVWGNVGKATDHPEQYGNGVGLFGKVLGSGAGLDAEGHRAAQSWPDALRQTANTVAHPIDTAGHFVAGIGQSFDDLDRLLQHPSHDRQWAEDVARPAFDITSTVAMGGGAVPKQAGTAGTFGGRLARTADHAALAQAEEMAGRGVPREAIWDQTGWFKGVDGKWRFEIDDSGSRLSTRARAEPTMFASGGRRPGDFSGDRGPTNVGGGVRKADADMTAKEIDDARLRHERAYERQLRDPSRAREIRDDVGNLFSHDALYAAYPELSEYPARFNVHPSGQAPYGAYGPESPGANMPTIVAGYRTNSSGRHTMLHELQHGIGDIEGFAKGAAEPPGREHRPSRAVLDEYYNSAGENEAEAVVSRLRHHDFMRGQEGAIHEKMSAMEKPPWESYRTPEEDQIVRFGNGGNNALFSNDSRASLPGAVVQFPSRRTPDGYRAPTTRDVEHPLMDAMKGGLETTRDVHQAAGPLMQRLESMGYVPYPDHLWDTPPTPEQYANGLLNFHRANREMDAAGIERTYRHAGELGVAISPDHAAHKPLLWDDAGNKILNLHPDTPPSAIARYLKDNNLFSNSKEASLPGTIVNAGNAKAAGEPRANHSVFDVAEQVARLIGSDPSAVRHHPTSFGNSSYLGGYRISDHPVGAGRYATEGGGFDSALGADAIAEQINNSRRNQIAEMLNAPPPERQPWMNGRDWSEERQRFANRRPGWLTKEQWDTLRQRHAAGEPLGDILKKYGIVGTAGVGGGMMYEPQDAAVIEKITGAGG